MEEKRLIQLAKEYCKHYHEGQIRKGSGEPYYKHPFEVAEILDRYGYSDAVTQCIALLHDIVEDSEMNVRQIGENFGYEIANGLYVLSKNTINSDTKEFLDNSMLNKNIENFSDEELYKMRMSFARRKVKRVKIADMIHNTKDLASLNPSGRERKLKDAREFYIPLGKKVAPLMIKKLEANIDNYCRLKVRRN